jgi:hypothetical protein
LSLLAKSQIGVQFDFWCSLLNTTPFDRTRMNFVTQNQSVLEVGATLRAEALIANDLQNLAWIP